MKYLLSYRKESASKKKIPVCICLKTPYREKKGCNHFLYFVILKSVFLVRYSKILY
jgi:hypothetical protein